MHLFLLYNCSSLEDFATKGHLYYILQSISFQDTEQRRSQGGAMGAKHPLDQWNLWISGGFQAPTCAEPPPGKKKNLSPPPGQIPDLAPV